MAMDTQGTKSSSFKVKNEGKYYQIDKSKIASPKSCVSLKENTKPNEFKFHTEERARKRAIFNYSVATKLYLTEIQKKNVEKMHKVLEEEEVRMLRREMIPRAQLMPLFDRPFLPQRSNRALTIPKEPSFQVLNSKCWSCISSHELNHFLHALCFECHYYKY